MAPGVQRRLFVMFRSGELLLDREGSVERVRRLHRELRTAVAAGGATSLAGRLTACFAELDRLLVFDSNEVERIAACGRAMSALVALRSHLARAARR